jgi:hypothetical protein
MNYRIALAALIAASTSLRLLAAGALGLGNDEAYHFLYAVHPAASYFDHPPMVAWVERLGLALTGPFSAMGLRLGFVALAAGSTWLMARIAGRWYGEAAGFYAALALCLSGYYGLAVGTFALPDGPLLFFWLLTLDRIDLALERPERWRDWLALGLAWGLAMCGKYHAVLLPAGTVLYLLLRPGRRRLLLGPGPYLAVATGLLVFSPVIAWNARNGWASFAFQGGRAIGGATPRPDYLLAAIGAQAAYLFPWIWLPLMVVGWRLARGWRDGDDERGRLALCLGATPLAVFTAVACFRPVLPHWGLVGVLPFFPALGRAFAERARANPGRTRRRVALASAFSVGLLALAIAQHHRGWLQRGPDGFGVLTAKTDPTADAYGWDQVADRLDRLGLLDDPRTFLFTRNWYQSAHLAHATRLRRPVACYNLADARGFAFWSDPADWLGRDGVMVMIGHDYTPFGFYEHWFRGVQALDDFEVMRAGKPIRRVRVFRMNDQRLAFPFDYAPRPMLPNHRSLDWYGPAGEEPPLVGEHRGVVRR